MLDTRFPSPEARAKYWVQWVTKFDSEQGHLQVVGHCVRSNKETLFQHKDYEVCVKVCEMLNEEEHNKC
jgi:hypothetical protein